MKKIISVITILIFVFSSIAYAQFEEPSGIVNQNPLQPKFSLIEFFKTLFTRPFAVLPSGYICSSKPDADKIFQATSTTYKLGNVCGNTAQIKLYECSSQDCCSTYCYYYRGQDYKIDEVKPTFGGLVIGTYYRYLCYNCQKEQVCTEGFISKFCDDNDVYGNYQKSDCSTEKRFIGNCGTGFVCKDGECFQAEECERCYTRWSTRNLRCGDDNNVIGDACDYDARYGTLCWVGRGIKTCNSDETCQNGECVKLSQTCADFGLQKCSLLNQWTDLRCSTDQTRIEGRRCTDMGLTTPCFQKGFLTKESCDDDERCENAKCVKFQQSCTDYGLQECSVGINQWTDLQCNSDNTAVIGRRCTDMGLTTPCFQKGFLTKEICGKTLLQKQKVCQNGECITPELPPTDNTCLWNNVEYNVGDAICPSGRKCDDEGFYCDPLNENQRKQLKITEVSNGFCKTETLTTKCGKSGLPLKQETCNPETATCERLTVPPEECASCGAEVFNVCNVAKCHSLGCFVSDDDKGFGTNREDNIISSDKCVSIIQVEKQCDSINDTTIFPNIQETCITKYCKKEFIEKGFFEKLKSGFISSRKPIYVCSEKPEGYCKYFIWVERLPFVDGDTACKIGTIIILLIIGGIGTFVYFQYFKKGKKQKKKKKSQAAIEFLMTYGWAILVVLAAIAALAYFGVLSPEKFLPNCNGLSIEKGVQIAEEKCGAVKETYSCNEDTNTLWIDLKEEKESCNPACVVHTQTKEAEINWRCTGIVP